MPTPRPGVWKPPAVASEGALFHIRHLLDGTADDTDVAWLREGLRRALNRDLPLEVALGLDAWRPALRRREMQHHVRRAARSLGANTDPWSVAKILHHESQALGWPVSGAVNTPLRVELYCASMALGAPLPQTVEGFYGLLARAEATF